MLMGFFPARTTTFADSGPAEDPDDGEELDLTLGLGSTRRDPPSAAPAPRPFSRLWPQAEVVEEIDKRKDPAFLLGGNAAPVQDRAAMEARLSESRERGRAVREVEAEAFADDRWRKGRGNGAGAPEMPRFLPFEAHPPPYPAMYAYHHHVQYVPVANGFGFPYLMPCWAPTISPTPAAGAEGLSQLEKCACQPEACRGFAVPVQVSEMKAGAKGVGNDLGVVLPTDSPASSASGISDHRSCSLRGRTINSSDSRSHLSHPVAAETSTDQLHDSQKHASATTAEVPAAAAAAADDAVSSAPKSSSLVTASMQPTSEDGKKKKKMTTTTTTSSMDDKSSASRIPCVSTTGDGPNGRTITGFLYRYTKSEVKIVCVCHGKSFSPAEFVRHAGCTDASQPLRQIVMVSSSEFGV